MIYITASITLPVPNSPLTKTSTESSLFCFVSVEDLVHQSHTDRVSFYSETCFLPLSEHSRPEHHTAGVE